MVSCFWSFPFETGCCGKILIQERLFKIEQVAPEPIQTVTQYFAYNPKLTKEEKEDNKKREWKKTNQKTQTRAPYHHTRCCS